MDCRNTMRFELNKGKRIGQVLFIVEGLRTEPNLIYKVFSGIFGYQMDRLYRNGNYQVFHRTDDPYSKVTVINTKESNIRFIDKNDEFLNRMFEILIEEYHLDIDNTAIYYVFDRDPASNTDCNFIENALQQLVSARDENPNWGQQGMLLLSYPCIESFVGMNLIADSINYCWDKGVSTGNELKNALNEDRLLPNRITEHTLIHCVEELIRGFDLIGVDTETDTFMNSLDQFGDNNKMVYSWEEEKYAQNGQYGLLSLLAIALLDLGLIRPVAELN